MDAVARTRTRTSAAATLAAAVLGFFVVTLDAVIVNVALPTVRVELGGGVTGSQWIVDGYTLMFAALLLSAGSWCDRLGARRAFGVGTTAFVLASLGCAVAPNLGALVAARFVQGTAAAAMMPASMTLVRQAYPERVARGRAIGIWAMGGSVAATAGPVLGGALTAWSWRAIFLINLPVGVIALLLLSRTAASPRRPVPADRVGGLSAVLGMCGLIYAAIEAGRGGAGSPRVLVALLVSSISFTVLVAAQRQAVHPMLPLDLFRSRTVRVSTFVGFAFMVGYYGVPFVLSLYLQEHRGLSPAATGVVFLPMMAIGLVLTPFSARLAERLGHRVLVVLGLIAMAIGLAVLAGDPTMPLVWLSVWMVPIGLAGPLVMPPTTAALLDAVPADRAGIASGVFNTSRQVGGALAVAVFGAVLAVNQVTTGVRLDLLLAAAIALAAAASARGLGARLSNENLDAGRIRVRQPERNSS